MEEKGKYIIAIYAQSSTNKSGAFMLNQCSWFLKGLWVYFTSYLFNCFELKPKQKLIKVIIAQNKYFMVIASKKYKKKIWDHQLQKVKQITILKTILKFRVDNH